MQAGEATRGLWKRERSICHGPGLALKLGGSISALAALGWPSKSGKTLASWAVSGKNGQRWEGIFNVMLSRGSANLSWGS